MRRYTVALAAVVASLLCRLNLQPWLGVKIPYLQFFLAIMVAAWFGGFGPGLLAVALSTALAVFFFIPPIGTPDVADAWFNHQLRHAETALRKAADDGERQAQAL